MPIDDVPESRDAKEDEAAGNKPENSLAAIGYFDGSAEHRGDKGNHRQEARDSSFDAACIPRENPDPPRLFFEAPSTPN